ncbi:MAG: hypothetical protein NC929_04380 [Candidatus Omnitrophica bacterium]|nr:hypothetical protein [Candidatus Omnitrophota bacterium]
MGKRRKKNGERGRKGYSSHTLQSAMKKTHRIKTYGSPELLASFLNHQEKKAI